MRKVILTTLAIILWSIPVILLVAMLVLNVDEVETFDLSAIKAGQIIAGTNKLMKPDFNCLSSVFMGKSYELVMVGTDRSKIIYLGKTAEEWYRAEENLDLRFFQEPKEVKIDGQDLVVGYGKDFGAIAMASIGSIILLGLIGLVVFIYRD